MNDRVKITLGIWVVLVAVVVASASAVADVKNLAKTTAFLDKLAQKEIDKGMASASVAIVHRDKVLWTGAYGYANVRLKAPASAKTIYPTASSLKPVTSTAILMLVEQGKINLDDPVNKYLGKHAVADDPRDSVTVRHLLDHTSGLSDDEGQAHHNLWDHHRIKISTLEEVALGMKTKEPVGTRHRYNNSAFGLAGLIIEKVAGVDYETFIVDNIFKPIGAGILNPINPTPAMTEMMAHPYTTLPGGQRAPSIYIVGSSPPAGGISYMRAEDMARFLGMVLNGGRFQGKQILSPKLLEIAHTPNTTNPEKYGLGWWIRDDGNGRHRISHPGRALGFTVAMIGDKNSGIGVYVMSNSTDQASYRIADGALRVMTGEEVSLQDRQPVHISAAAFKRLEGKYYQQKSEWTYIITNEDQRLLMSISIDGQPPGGAPLVYDPASDTVFFDRGYGVKLEFVENEAGEITGFDMKQHGWMDYGFAERLTD